MNLDTTFDLLSSPVRRGIVTVLHESDSVSRDRLADELASDGDADHQIRVALHHNHLPKLADADLITYDEETVTATSRLKQVACQFHVPDGDDGTPVPA